MIWLPSSLKSLLAHSPLTKCCTRTWMPLIWMPSSLKSFHAHSPFDPVVARDGERLGALTVKSQRMHVSEEVLGQGSFGRVMAGTLNIGGGRVTKVAVKSLPAMTIPQKREAFQRELKAHIHALRHCDGICKLYGTCERDNRLSLVMKLYEGGSLAKKIRGGPLDADKICRYSSVLRQLHACRLVVHDIKPSNILFDSFDQSVPADFGIAEVVSTATRRLLTSINGTFNYMAPETLDAEAGGPGIGPDVWGMACVVVEMHTGKVPWDGMNIQQIMRVVSVDYRAPAVSETAPAHALLGRCFMRNSEHRPSAGDLADACAPPSGARYLIPELCEEMDRLNAANTMLDARLKATEALLAEEQLEREKLARDKTDLEAQVALVKLEKRQEEALRLAAEAKVAAAEGKVVAAEGKVAAVGSAGIFGCQTMIMPGSRYVTSVTWNNDGSKLATGSGDETAMIWSLGSTGTLECKSTLRGHSDSVMSVTWNNDGTKLATGSLDRTVRIWSVSSTGTFECQSTLTVGSPVYCVAFSPDGSKIAAAYSNGIQVFDAQTQAKLGSPLSGHSEMVNTVTWSPDGKSLASADDDETVRIWDVSTGQCRSLTGHSSYVMSVAWNNDGTKLASGSFDETVRIWSVGSAGTFECESTLSGHSDYVRAVSWSPDGTMIVSGSDDDTIKVWDAQSGKVNATLIGHSRSVLAVTWSPDGKSLASGSDDETVMIWCRNRWTTQVDV